MDLVAVPASTAAPVPTTAGAGIGARIWGLGQTCVDGVCTAARSVQATYEGAVEYWNSLAPEDRAVLMYLAERGLAALRPAEERAAADGGVAAGAPRIEGAPNRLRRGQALRLTNI
jgi:hypothetical protein